MKADVAKRGRERIKATLRNAVARLTTPDDLLVDP